MLKPVSQHVWTLPDAQLLIRTLQAVAWKDGWHIALGGGVLNNGYSDKDLDIYILPVYGMPRVSALTMLSNLAAKFDNENIMDPVCSLQDNPHECFEYAMRFYSKSRPVELFFVRP